MFAKAHLWLDDLLFGAVSIEPGDVDFTVEVANVANNGVLQHLLEVMRSQNSFATRCRHVYSRLSQCVVDRGHLVT